jgi:threonine dehydratase
MGRETVIIGDVWDATHVEALAFAAKQGAAYFHPFADPLVVAGQGTVGLEILDQNPEVEVVLVAIGGGGLISGVATALKALRPSVRVIGVEAAGSPTLKDSVQAGHTVTLERVTTSVATMACARTDDRILDIVRRTVDEIVLVDDSEMREAAKWLWFEMGLAADLSGAAALAALQTGKLNLGPGTRACVIVCGAGAEALAT